MPQIHSLVWEKPAKTVARLTARWPVLTLTIWGQWWKALTPVWGRRWVSVSQVFFQCPALTALVSPCQFFQPIQHVESVPMPNLNHLMSMTNLNLFARVLQCVFYRLNKTKRHLSVLTYVFLVADIYRSKLYPQYVISPGPLNQKINRDLGTILGALTKLQKLPQKQKPQKLCDAAGWHIFSVCLSPHFNAAALLYTRTTYSCLFMSEHPL